MATAQAEAHAFHPEFNYEDGSVVLVVQDSVSFKVHKGVLSQHSYAFRDMFSLPAVPMDMGAAMGDTGEIKTGVKVASDGDRRPSIPVVHLPQDDAKGFADVLRALYGSR